MINKKDINKKCLVNLFDGGMAEGIISNVKNGIAVISNMTIKDNHRPANGEYTSYIDIKKDGKRISIIDDPNYSSIEFFYSN